MKNKDNLNKSGRRDDPSPATISDETFESLVRKDEIRKEVEAQIRKEVEFLKESLGLSMKIVRGSVAIFLILLAYFGYTTWKVIEDKATAIMEDKTDKVITKNDSETGVKYKLTSLLNKAVIDSVLIAKAKNLGKESPLPENDWERLRASLKIKALSLQDFMDTLAVLNMQSTDRKKKDSMILAEFLSPVKSQELSWVINEPEKLEAILDIFKDENLGPSAANIITSEIFNKSIKEKAANYVRDVGDSSMVRRLIGAYPHLEDGPVKNATLLACLVLRPGEPKVLQELSSILSKPPSFDSSVLAADALLAIAENKPKTSDDMDVKGIEDISKVVFQLSIKSGVFLSYSLRKDESYKNMSRNVIDPEIEVPHQVPIFKVWISRFSGGDPEMRGQISLESLKGFNLYWAFLANSANAGELESVKAMLPRVNSYNSQTAYEVMSYDHEISMVASGEGFIVVNEDQSNLAEIDVHKLSDATVSVDTLRGLPATVDIFNDKPKMYIRWSHNNKKHKATVKEIKKGNYKFWLNNKADSLDFDNDKR